MHSDEVLKDLRENLCGTAKLGLVRCYKSDELPYTTRYGSESGYTIHDVSVRYAAISQIGIMLWLHHCPKEKSYLPDLWPRILARVNDINNIGDFALLMWAAAESGRDDCERFAKILVQQWPGQKNMCNAVELGWIVQSLVCLSSLSDLTADANAVLTSASERLLGLYKPNSRLFARHNRAGLTEKLSRRIACFADQVYPILALASYGRHFDDKKSIDIAVAVADTICRLQGPLGQWWWHYDVQTGKVAEEYPVFSVHQHGMAPMALFAIDAIAGTNHKSYIEKGLGWLDEQNELNEQMIEPDKGIIWRDIHRREFGKMFRLVRGLLVTAGLDGLHRLTGRNILGYGVNRECRPYELGWLLYAWAPVVHKSN
jgi:hypothetical protein